MTGSSMCYFTERVTLLRSKDRVILTSSAPQSSGTPPRSVKAHENTITGNVPAVFSVQCRSSRVKLRVYMYSAGMMLLYTNTHPHARTQTHPQTRWLFSTNMDTDIRYKSPQMLPATNTASSRAQHAATATYRQQGTHDGAAIY